MKEFRSGNRRRILKAATASFNDKWYPIECQIRDISESGCRLRTNDTETFPHAFELSVDLDGLVVDCEVVWRGETDVGVAFTSPPKFIEPKRYQIIHAAGPAEGRLRRRVLGSKRCEGVSI